MPCGTGKTLVGPYVVENIDAISVLIFVPSLLLTRQLLEVYRKQLPKASYLAVCSNIDVIPTEDSPLVDDIECPSTTEVRDVRDFLKGVGRRIVICTYQSASVLDGLSFDLAIFDEAHRTAGVAGKPFAFGLLDENIKCNYRLFMTATPRHVAITENGDETEVYSMDDPETYGPVFYKMAFRKAIDRGLICDYRIVISVFNSPKEPMEEATRIAIRRAMHRYGAKKVFTFHRTVNAARHFIETKSMSNISLSHINGRHSSAERASLLAKFQDASIACMSNARCLTEGVDLPSVDMVAFLSTQRSDVAIVQATGRALRLSRGKKRAIIFLPIFVKERAGESVEEAVKRTRFDKVHEVVQTLREQDEVLAAWFMVNERKNKSLPDNIEIDISEDAFPGVSGSMIKRMRRYVTVRMLKPFKTERLKAALLRAARSGEPKPEGNLFGNFRRYTDPSGVAYDDIFAREIKEIAPHWFPRRGDSLRKALVGLARSGEAMPTNKSILGHALSNAKQSARRGYKPAQNFILRLKKIAPKWFDFIDIWAPRKKRVLAFAMTSASKIPLSRVKDREIVITVRTCTGRGKRLDRAFDDKLHVLAPHWFLAMKTRRAKQKLMDIARSGKPKPMTTSGDEQERSLALRLHNYTFKSSSSSYDPVFMAQLRKLAPHWFEDSSETFKARILRKASGSPKPRSRLVDGRLNPEYRQVGGYAWWSSQESYDSDFACKLKKVAPHWFKGLRINLQRT